MYRVEQMNRYIQMNSLKTVQDEARARCSGRCRRSARDLDSGLSESDDSHSRQC